MIWAAFLLITLGMTFVVLIRREHRFKIFWPYRSLEMFSLTSDLKYCVGREGKVASNLQFPIFIITRDRVNSLRRAISSYNRLSTPWHLIICDHNSTYPPMVAYLDELKHRGVTIFHIRSSAWSEVIKDIRSYIQQYLAFHPDFKYYVVTDPDIGLNISAPDIMLFFAGVLETCPGVNVVGPALQITNIPDYYRMKQKVITHESQFWRSVPSMATWKGNSYHLAIQPIDTTFAMRRRTTAFVPLHDGTIRTYAPYMAIHLDWYLNSSDPGDDYRWYIRHQSGINHWR
ncbi:unnamed protein product [Rotaria magnacalcarata]|uniref:Uncharacterized protein n=1 Tax=Rotaria magnacalcarata TaxID=392030 RepID=A0A816N2T5_9BILA|nr:unnamed protein product [Rotaria magnacalcarata]CAF4365610.1 unnamed protein product [Rotaria magnacalcarata]